MNHFFFYYIGAIKGKWAVKYVLTCVHICVHLGKFFIAEMYTYVYTIYLSIYEVATIRWLLTNVGVFSERAL